MNRYIPIVLCLTVAFFVPNLGAQMNGAGDLSHPTVDELHKKLNELVSRFKADQDEKRKKADAANTSKDKKQNQGPSDEFRILLDMGGKRTAGDRDNPVIFEEMVLKLAGGNIVSIDLRYEEAALRRQMMAKRSIFNDDIKKTSYGHLKLSYQAQGDLPKSEILLNMNTEDRAKLLSIYIDGLLRGIRELDNRVLAAKQAAGKKMNDALNMGIRIR